MDKVKLLQKHAPQYIHSTRKDLSGIIVDPEGAGYVTNAHHLLRVQSFADPGDAFQLFNTKTLKPIKLKKDDEPIPENIVRLVPTEYDFVFEIDIWDLPEAMANADALYAAAIEAEQKNHSVRMKQENGEVTVQFTSPELSGKIVLAESDDPIDLQLSAEYLFRALKVFHDAGTATLRFQVRTDRLRPLHLCDAEQGIDVVIMPLRVY